MAKDDGAIVVVHCRGNDLAKRIPADHKPIKGMKIRSVTRAISSGRPHTKRKVHDIVKPDVPIKRKKRNQGRRHNAIKNIWV